LGVSEFQALRKAIYSAFSGEILNYPIYCHDWVVKTSLHLLVNNINPSSLHLRVYRHADRRLGMDTYKEPGKWMADLRQFVRLEKEMLRRYHEKRDPGLTVCHAYAVMIDVLLEALLSNALRGWLLDNKALPTPMAIIASGGYGRSELCPHSDIDISLLYGSSSGRKLREFQEWITGHVLYPLWDLKFTVGHASRTIKESITEARADMQTKTSLMQSRHVCGDAELSEEFREKFRKFLQKDAPEEYLKVRRQDQKARRAKHLNTVFVQEPDIKNGVGGLRDYQNLIWMAEVKFGISTIDGLLDAGYIQKGEYTELTEAYDFLLRVRNELHFQSPRATDVLLLETQPLVAFSLGYRHRTLLKRVERFMRHYYAHARNIFTLTNALEKHFLLPEETDKGFRIRFGQEESREIDGFLLSDGELELVSDNIFEEDPVRLVRVFRLCQQYEARLGPRLVRKIQESRNLLTPSVAADEHACKAFRSILQTAGQVYPALSSMHDLGILGRFLPEFEGLTCLVQHEYYHRYTADIHTLTTIRNLDEVFLRDDPLHQKFRECLRETKVPTILYLVLLLHDIGKSKGIKGHAETGVEMSGPIMDRIGIPPAYQEPILFVIEHHLAMSRFAQKHDVDDPETCQLFAEFIKTPDLLRFLYVHTYCDTQGTAPDLWNSFKESLLDSLYRGTLHQLLGREGVLETAEKLKLSLRGQINERDLTLIPQEEVDAHFDTLLPRYFLHTSVAEIELHLRMVHELLENLQEGGEVAALVPVVHWEDDLDRGFSIVTLVTWDRPALFCRLAGAFTLSGLNILGSKAFSRTDSITIDTFFVVEPGGGVVQGNAVREQFVQEMKGTLQELRHMLDRIQEQEDAPEDEGFLHRPPERLGVPFPPKVSAHKEPALRRTIIEVQARDSLGLLYKLAREITHAGYDITFARVTTENSVALDTFHIETIPSGGEISMEQLELLRQRLENLVAEPEVDGGKAAAG
jgi:[protein-PII] uridylyltransferase